MQIKVKWEFLFETEEQKVYLKLPYKYIQEDPRNTGPPLREKEGDKERGTGRGLVTRAWGTSSSSGERGCRSLYKEGSYTLVVGKVESIHLILTTFVSYSDGNCDRLRRQHLLHPPSYGNIYYLWLKHSESCWHMLNCTEHIHIIRANYN